MALPDLHPISLTLNNNTVTATGRITFNYSISNIGAASASASFAGLYLSTDSNVTTSDTLIEVRNTSALGVNQSFSESSVPWDLSNLLTSLAPGNYWLGIIADYPAQISETKYPPGGGRLV